MGAIYPLFTYGMPSLITKTRKMAHRVLAKADVRRKKRFYVRVNRQDRDKWEPGLSLRCQSCGYPTKPPAFKNTKRGDSLT